MSEELVEKFRDSLSNCDYLTALQCANQYESATGRVIDCSDDEKYPCLFWWAWASHDNEATRGVFDVIERGGGVTVKSATRLHNNRTAMTLAMVDRRGSDVWLAPLLATPRLRPAWSMRQPRRVPLHEFLLNLSFVHGTWSCAVERLALELLAQTSIELITAEFNACVHFAVCLDFMMLGAELMRRKPSSYAWFPRYTNATIWIKIHANWRSYYADLVPALRQSLDISPHAHNAMPTPLLELIARFVRGPFEL
jgi:hypothetical protein